MTLPPMPKDLPKDERELLLRTDAENVIQIEQLGDEWRDDHIDCVAVRVHIEGRTIDTSLWWCEPELIGAIKYSDESSRAMRDILRAIKSELTNTK